MQFPKLKSELEHEEAQPVRLNRLEWRHEQGEVFLNKKIVIFEKILNYKINFWKIWSFENDILKFSQLPRRRSVADLTSALNEYRV